MSQSGGSGRMDNPASPFLKGTLILTAAGMVVKVIGSLNWIFLSRILGGEGIGIYQMAFPLYLLALSVSSAGVPVAVSILTAEKIALRDYRGANRVFILSFTLLFATGLALSLLLYLGAGWLTEYRIIRDPRAYYALVALSPAIFLVTLLSSFRGYFQGWQIMTPTAVSQVVEQIFRVAAMLTFASLLLPGGLALAAGGASLGAAAGAAAALAVLVYYYWRLEKERRRIAGPPPDAPPVLQGSRGVIKRLAALTVPVSLSSLILPLGANLDLLIVPRRLEAAGYSVEQATELFGYLTGMAVPLVNLATVLTAALATGLVPAIARAHSLGGRQDIYHRTGGAMRLASIATIPFGVMLWVLAGPVVEAVYDAPGAGGVTRILAAGVFFLGVHNVTTGALQGLGRTAVPLVNMGVSALVKVILNWTLTAIPGFGIEGAAWATLADLGVAAVLNLYFVHRYTGFFPNGRDLLKNCGAAAAMGMIMHWGYPPLLALLPGPLAAIAAAAAGGGCAYLGIMLLSGGLTSRDLERLPFFSRQPGGR